ncbi:ASCH domain-containing protein [Pseudoalteromonas piscicida]|uniref:ASCH domain-containing protein n=1 Tax=Pseudoalteromonas piscicida TaxID=43662 RepID=UPI0005FA33E4|nr:hypothetical protein TW73_09115 [Pseudoalteromonas piscicida]
MIKSEWLDKIFNSGKCWEMRSRPTKIRGKIKLINSGTGLIVGECYLTTCHKLAYEGADRQFDYHQVSKLDLLEKWCWAWHLAKVKKYDKPIPYSQPQGAVIWVNLYVMPRAKT